MIRPKLIYLARRNPELSPETFIPRWRQHGALGMRQPRWRNIWRYAHADVLRGTGAVGVSEAYDGVGTVWHRSAEARRAHREDRSSQGTMERDELKTFDRLVTAFCAIYEEEVRSAPLRGARIRLARFLAQPSAADPMARLAAAGLTGSVAGFVRNRRALPEAAPWGLEFEQIDELWFADIAAAAAVQAALAADEGLAADVSLLTAETVLYHLPEAE